MRPDGPSTEELALDANGIRFHALAAGPAEGPLVVCLHGFPELARSWRHQLPALATAGYRAVAPDLRGYGGTDMRGPYDVRTLVGDVTGLIAALGRERAVLVGHDWGGAVAWATAMRAPEAVDRLVAVNCPPASALSEAMRRSPSQLAKSWYILFFQLPWLPERRMAKDGAAVVARALVGGSHRRGVWPPEELAAYRAAFARPIPPCRRPDARALGGRGPVPRPGARLARCLAQRAGGGQRSRGGADRRRGSLRPERGARPGQRRAAALARAGRMSTSAFAMVAAATAAATSTWIAGTPLAEPRTEVAAAPLGARIVVVGGFLANGGNSRRVDAYDPDRHAWARLPDLPVSVDHAAAAAWRGRLVVVGGYGVDRAPLQAAFLYDGRRWRRLPAPPEERAAAAAAATADGRVWVVGGRTRSGLATRALSLDLRTLRWRTAPGPRPREHLAATALGGRVFAIGGRLAGYDTNLGTVEAYDPRTNRWSRLPDLPDPRGGTGAASIAGRLVSVGGESPSGTNRTVWALRPGGRAWTRLQDLRTPRHGLGVVAFRGRVWAIAGGPEPGLTVSGAVESLVVR